MTEREVARDREKVEDMIDGRIRDEGFKKKILKK